MGSRLKQNPERTFHWCFEAACPVARDKDPGVLYQFPEDFRDEENCQTLPRFCFPFDIQRARDAVPVQHFTFVLTDLEGCQRFGFCRLTNSRQTCLCILSYLPWFEVFYKLLNNLAEYVAKGQTTEMSALLAAVYKQPIPQATGSVILQMVPYFIAPDPRGLPSIPENRNLTELIVAVDVGNLLQLYASLLFERRILIFASKLSTLTSCVHAVSAVLYPMYWQHIFIPVLPPHLLDYCCAPMPYLIGVHTSLSERVRSRGLEEVVTLNVDTNTLETPFDDRKRIPSDVMAGLKVRLKCQAVSPGCGVSKAFLKAQALLFGSYKDALQGHKESEVWFSEELFLDHRSSSMREFLQSAVHLQFFKEFIDGRLDILNKGKEPDDLFEEEILKCETTTGRRNSYQQLVGNIKKGGGALILNMKSKANIKAKSLVKSGLKNLLLHKAHNEGNTPQRGGSMSHRCAQSDSLQDRLPTTQHFGMSRPRRPLCKHRASRVEQDMEDTIDTWNGAMSRPPFDSDLQLQREEEEGEDSRLCDPEEMDLLGEIFDTLSSRSSHDRGLLYGTRSLDLFGPDSHDYITKHGFQANTSQESLPLSISGNGSLHSWNLETTEELSDLTKDSDWLCVATCAPEEEGTESLLAACDLGEQEHRRMEVSEKHEEVKVAEDGDQEEEKDDRDNIREVRAEKERENDGQEERESFGDDPVRELAERPEDDKLKEKRDDEQNQTMEVHEGQGTEKGTNEMLKDVTREEGGEDQEEKGKEVTGLKRLTKPERHHSNTVEKQQGKEENLSPTAPHGPSVLAADPKPPAGHEHRSEAVVKTEQERKRTPSPHEVLSATVLLPAQMRSQGLQVKSRAKELAEPRRPSNMSHSRQRAQTHLPGDSNVARDNSCSEGYKEEDLPSVKVSELKKRFEA